nr:hypothetical protein [Tanacetum cinerariifolium]
MRIEERATWEREQYHMGGRGESFGTVPMYYGAQYRAVEIVLRLWNFDKLGFNVRLFDENLLSDPAFLCGF